MASDIQKLRQRNVFGVTDINSPIGNVNIPPVQFEGPEPSPIGQVDFSGTRNPFAQSVAVPQVDNTPEEPNSSMLSLWEQINKIYTPETTSRDRFNRLLDSFPQREEPSFGRKLVASGMGWDARQRRGVPGQEFTAGANANPLETMEKVMYAPFIRDVSEWREKTGPFQASAQQENTANINERTLAGNLINAQVQADRIASQDRIAAEKNRVAEIRAKATWLKAQGWTIKVVGDRLVGFDPNNPGVPQDLGPSGGMDEIDKINLQGEWGVKRAEALGDAAMNRTEAAGWIHLTDPDGKSYRYNPRTGEKEWTGATGGTPTRPGTPSRTGASDGADVPSNNAQYEYRLRMMAAEPGASEFIKSINGELRLVAPDTAAMRAAGVSTEEINQKWTQFKGYVRRINPELANSLDRDAQTRAQQRQGQPVQEGAPPRGGRQTDIPLPPQGAAPSAPRGAQQVPSGDVRVRDIKTGKEFYVRPENLQRALDTKRYERVQ